MRYNKIRKMDISNGPGVRVSVFFQGCAFHCFNCFNPETWDFDKGEEFTDETIEHILDLCDNDYIVGLSMLGGEPMHPTNLPGTTKLAKAGFTYEDYVSKQEVINYLDVLVDGQFVDELFDPSLKYCGSSNQRAIDVKKSLKAKKVVLFDDEEDE